MWSCRVIALALIIGLTTYLARVGLARADELASVLGLLVAVLALVAPYLLSSGQDSSGDAAPSRASAGSAAPEPPVGPVQSVEGSVVGGDLVQSVDVTGRSMPDAGNTASSEDDAPAASPPAGQYVSGVWVGGNLTQINGGKGDVTL